MDNPVTTSYVSGMASYVSCVHDHSVWLLNTRGCRFYDEKCAILTMIHV